MSEPAPKSRPYAALSPGDPAPWFNQRSLSNPNYAFSSVGGRYVVLCFFGSAALHAHSSILPANHAWAGGIP